MAFTNISYNVETKKISFSYTPDDNIGIGTNIYTNFKLTDANNIEYFGINKTITNWLNFPIPTPDYSSVYVGATIQNYIDFFNIPIDLAGNIISGIYTLTYNQNFVGSLQTTPQQFSIQFEILEYNVLANNVNIDLIENCNELLISNTTNEIQYFDITSLNDLGLFVKNESISATTTLSNNIFYNRLITEIVSVPLVNDIQILQPYQYVKLILKDQLYKITWKTVTGTLQVKYVAKDCNIKKCLINKLNDILCTKVGDCDNSCDLILEYIKVKSASDAIYFLWNRWSQSNIMLDVSQSSNYRLREYSEWLKLIEENCNDCLKVKNDCGCH